MTQTNSDGRKSLVAARRLTLLASVGAIGATVLLAGPASYWQSAAGALPANAAESGMQRPLPIGCPGPCQGICLCRAKSRFPTAETSGRTLAGSGQTFLVDA